MHGIVIKGAKAMATGNMYRKFCEVWTCIFSRREWTDRQT